jgi:citrate synthase
LPEKKAPVEKRVATAQRQPASGLLTADEAAKTLRVKPATLYAYVSRGLLRSFRGAEPRSRFYRREEVDALRRKRTQRSDPEKVAEAALQWGAPVLESAITLIEDGDFYYRGWRATDLARTRTFEDVVAMLWGLNDEAQVGAGEALFSDARRPLDKETRQLLAAARDSHPADALHLLIRLFACRDFGAANLSPEAVRRTGARLLTGMVSAAAAIERLQRGSLAQALVAGWAPGRDELVPVVDATLILCADHELNVSSFTARCVASARATPYDVVDAGLCALRGAHHGGHSDRVEAMLSEVGVLSGAPVTKDRARRLLGSRLQRGDRLPGFGQPLYPSGDPRYRMLMEMLEERLPHSTLVRSARVVADQGRDLIAREPTVDFGLAVVAAELGRFPGGAFTLFALGRTAGWIAHAIEQYQRDVLIRPRARYSGPLPRG